MNTFLILYRDDMIWDFTYLPLKVKTLSELVSFYNEIL